MINNVLLFDDLLVKPDSRNSWLFQNQHRECIKQTFNFQTTKTFILNQFYSLYLNGVIEVLLHGASLTEVRSLSIYTDKTLRSPALTTTDEL